MLTNADRVVHILFLDFRKAFDKVDLIMLLTKLATTGIPDISIQWVLYMSHKWFKNCV